MLHPQRAQASYSEVRWTSVRPYLRRAIATVDAAGETMLFLPRSFCLVFCVKEERQFTFCRVLLCAVYAHTWYSGDYVTKFSSQRCQVSLLGPASGCTSLVPPPLLAGPWKEAPHRRSGITPDMNMPVRRDCKLHARGETAARTGRQCIRQGMERCLKVQLGAYVRTYMPTVRTLQADCMYVPGVLGPSSGLGHGSLRIHARSMVTLIHC